MFGLSHPLVPCLACWGLTLSPADQWKALLDRQDEDGSWQNKQDRWMEGMKTLATAFAMQTLGVLNGRLD